ncbi:MAG: hypothetical protein E7218_00545 [Anaerofustis stercorihominis]|nr:hypothetical protein [Anaerofustis stercorihominis]
MTFEDKDKIDAFDEIAKRYFEKNFGTMSKTDFETLLFHIYIENLLKNSENFDDYTISKELGITQSKVRTLKVRKELQYPREGFEWKEAFVQYIENAHYDEQTRRVSVIIPDINVHTELRYFMECNGLFDDYSLNPKLLRCHVSFFIDLIEILEDGNLELEDGAENKLLEIKNECTERKIKDVIDKFQNGLSTTKDLIDIIVSVGSGDIIKGVLSIIRFGNGFAKGISSGLTKLIN